MSELRRVPLDHAQERAVEPVRQRVNELAGMEILNGHLLENVQLTANVVTRIPHKLGRRLRGWIIVRNNFTDTARVWVHDRQSKPPPEASNWAVNPRPESELWLYASSQNARTFTASIWVF